MIRFLIPVLSLMLSPAACLAAEALSTNEIESEIVGQSISWWEADGWRHGSLVLAPDGRAEITVSGMTGDVGRWSLRDGRICTVWNGIRDGAEKCYSLRRDGENHFVTSGGNVFEVRFAGA